jgi:hypothetical protein
MELSGRLEMPGKEPLVPNEQGGRQGQSGCFGEEENLFSPPGIETHYVQSTIDTFFISTGSKAPRPPRKAKICK